MKHIKQFQKDAWAITGTGIGLSVMSGVSGDTNTSKAIGTLGSGLGMMANLSTMKATTGILQSSFKVKKK
jgi:hypothetical protein